MIPIFAINFATRFSYWKGHFYSHHHHQNKSKWEFAGRTEGKAKAMQALPVGTLQRITQSVSLRLSKSKEVSQPLYLCWLHLDHILPFPPLDSRALLFPALLPVAKGILPLGGSPVSTLNVS